MTPDHERLDHERLDHERLDHLVLLAADVDAFVAAIASGPASAEIGGCPGWTLVDLGTHLGVIHRWARAAILTCAPPRLDPASDPAPTEPTALSQWVRAG